jgi:NAD(P) transhydrogenase subunit beta
MDLIGFITSTSFIASFYLVSAALFLLGIKYLSSPATARMGNLLSSSAMLIAIVVTLLNQDIISYGKVGIGLVIGAIIGAFLARFVKMTAMPQLVGFFNGMGGGASALIAVSEFLRYRQVGATPGLDTSISITFSILIGVVTLSGSMIAFGKLQELLSTQPITYPLQKTLNLAIFLAIVGIMIYLVVAGPNIFVFVALCVLALALGILLVLPIGGADMPVVISLLNSYSGLAAAAAGFVIGNSILIIGGSMVGAAGFILTRVMCKAMNRSLWNVVFGAFGAVTDGGSTNKENEHLVRSVAAEDAAIVLGYAKLVIFVPGYGLAVAQAQHSLRELSGLLEARGVEVKYAIHPVAGRMPGHMNVLLAEADIPYDKLYDMNDINDDFPKTDVAVVIGANDVINPAARNEEGSPIYGMPILNVDQAKVALILKRSLSPGFAGIDNELFYRDKTMMFFGDAKASIVKLIDEVKNL